MWRRQFSWRSEYRYEEFIVIGHIENLRTY